MSQERAKKAENASFKTGCENIRSCRTIDNLFDVVPQTMLPQILKNVPAGAATKQIVHYGQLAREIGNTSL